MQCFAARILAVILFFTMASLPLAAKPVYSSDIQKDLIAKINGYRASENLPPLIINPSTCQFAAIRVREAAVSFNHNGFYNRIKSYTLPYPKYRLVTENLAWAPNKKDPVNMWINSPSHAANLLKNTSFACVEKYGDYYAFESLKV